MIDKDKTELTDDDLDAVQGGRGTASGTSSTGAGLNKIKDLGSTRVGGTGSIVPGSDLMEGEEEELQTRPNPADMGSIANRIPRGPGIK